MAPCLSDAWPHVHAWPRVQQSSNQQAPVWRGAGRRYLVPGVGAAAMWISFAESGSFPSPMLTTMRAPVVRSVVLAGVPGMPFSTFVVGVTAMVLIESCLVFASV